MVESQKREEEENKKEVSEQDISLFISMPDGPDRKKIYCFFYIFLYFFSTQLKKHLLAFMLGTKGMRKKKKMTKTVFTPKSFINLGKQMLLIICYKWQNKMNGFHLELGEKNM